MVDALKEVHRILAPRGLLVDARPDSRRLARAEQVTKSGHRSIGTIGTARIELANDATSDRAIARVAREKLFSRGKSGWFWHRVPFDDLAGLQGYIKDHLRFEHRIRWTVTPTERRRIREEHFTIRRSVRFELLRKLG